MRHLNEEIAGNLWDFHNAQSDEAKALAFLKLMYCVKLLAEAKGMI